MKAPKELNRRNLGLFGIGAILVLAFVPVFFQSFAVVTLSVFGTAAFNNQAGSCSVTGPALTGSVCNTSTGVSAGISNSGTIGFAQSGGNAFFPNTLIGGAITITATSPSFASANSQGGSFSSGSQISTTITATAGDLLVAAVAASGSSNFAVPFLSDSQSLAWSLVVSQNGYDCLSPPSCSSQVNSLVTIFTATAASSGSESIVVHGAGIGSESGLLAAFDIAGATQSNVQQSTGATTGISSIIDHSCFNETVVTAPTTTPVSCTIPAIAGDTMLLGNSFASNGQPIGVQMFTVAGGSDSLSNTYALRVYTPTKNTPTQAQFFTGIFENGNITHAGSDTITINCNPTNALGGNAGCWLWVYEINGSDIAHATGNGSQFASTPTGIMQTNSTVITPGVGSFGLSIYNPLNCPVTTPFSINQILGFGSNFCQSGFGSTAAAIYNPAEGLHDQFKANVGSSYNGYYSESAFVVLTNKQAGGTFGCPSCVVTTGTTTFSTTTCTVISNSTFCAPTTETSTFTSTIGSTFVRTITTSTTTSQTQTVLNAPNTDSFQFWALPMMFNFIVAFLFITPAIVTKVSNAFLYGMLFTSGLTFGGIFGLLARITPWYDPVICALMFVAVLVVRGL